VANNFETVENAAGDMANNAASRVRATVNQAGETIRETAGSAAHEIRGLGDQLTASVKEQPFAAVLIAGGIGLAIGWLMNR